MVASTVESRVERWAGLMVGMTAAHSAERLAELRAGPRVAMWVEMKVDQTAES